MMSSYSQAQVSQGHPLSNKFGCDPEGELGKTQGLKSVAY